MPASPAELGVQSSRPYASVVAGTDFTPSSAVAIGQALRVAAWSGAPVHVIHVIDTNVVIELEAALSDFQKSIRESLARDAQQAWVEFAATIPGASRLEIEVSINNRIVGILNHAQKHKADLLVMGAFGERRADVGFGTVATACVRKSSMDVLLARDSQAARPFKKVVAAVDFSATSARALARAALVAARDDAELHVLHVFDAPWRRLHYRAPSPLAPPHLQKQYRDALDRRLAEFVQPVSAANAQLRLRPVCHDTNSHRSGIVEYALSVAADLIVLGTRGQSNLRDIMLGSTAEKALSDSPCSVLAVKPE
jgi:nucleotide-binding universal stress UspA family protein